MTNKVPISLIVDDSCPLIHAYYYSSWSDKGDGPQTKDGRPLAKIIPNSFLDKYCDITNAHGMAGKISVVPIPTEDGDIVNGFPGYDYSIVKEWLDTVNERLSPRFDFSPEVLTHFNALDLNTGEFLNMDEETWSFQQDRTTLTPYIAKSFELLKAAGIDASGVTSPWSFGLKVEDEYIAAIAAAQLQVYGRELSWYFLHCLERKPHTRPWIAYKEGNQTLVSIPTTLNDRMWDTIDCPRTDEDFINSIADKYLTKDGQDGGIIRVLKAGGWPLLCTHWQSLFSNGLETGLKVLNEVGERVNKHLSDQVEWKSCMEITQMVVEQNMWEKP